MRQGRTTASLASDSFATERADVLEIPAKEARIDLMEPSPAARGIDCPRSFKKMETFCGSQGLKTV